MPPTTHSQERDSFTYNNLTTNKECLNRCISREIKYFMKICQVSKKYQNGQSPRKSYRIGFCTINRCLKVSTQVSFSHLNQQKEVSIELLIVSRFGNRSFQGLHVTPPSNDPAETLPTKVKGRPAEKICFPAKFEIKDFPHHASVVSPLKLLPPRQKLYNSYHGYI